MWIVAGAETETRIGDWVHLGLYVLPGGTIYLEWKNPVSKEAGSLSVFQFPIPLTRLNPKTRYLNQEMSL